MKSVGVDTTTFSLAGLMDCNKTFVWLGLKKTARVEFDMASLKQIFREGNKGRDNFDQGWTRFEVIMVDSLCKGIEILYWWLCTWIKVPFLIHDMFVVLIPCWVV